MVEVNVKEEVKEEEKEEENTPKEEGGRSERPKQSKRKQKWNMFSNGGMGSTNYGQKRQRVYFC